MLLETGVMVTIVMVTVMVTVVMVTCSHPLMSVKRRELFVHTYSTVGLRVPI